MRASEAAALSSDIIGEVLVVPVAVAFVDVVLMVDIAKVAALPTAFRLPGLVFDFAFDGDFAGDGNFFPLRPGEERTLTVADCVDAALCPALEAAEPTVAFDRVFGDALVGVLFPALVDPAR
jgi:hypothetical protein